jgi:hypothetical protein
MIRVAAFDVSEFVESLDSQHTKHLFRAEYFTSFYFGPWCHFYFWFRYKSNKPMSTVLCPHLNQTLRVSSIESLFHCTHQHLENDLHEAWNLWYNALGPVGEESGHKLQFFEFFYGPEEWWYCYTERKHDKDLWEWNPTVPCGAATILESLVRVSGLNPSAMVGYIPQDWPRGPLPGRMDIRVNLGQAGDYRIHQAWIAALAHELGKSISIVA